ncbi:hypothetical protein ACF3DV_23710 [Chlorogloeopsis fritschii PCC 9212]|uniref:Uncharacterized protein n=1 Tax=Chlorogloeopsis fritschii PCC 6912 TaxID=211165 RepID=A0A3S0XG35_CHLFR|nr:hypothetical protein [Chlorogloeopsis fritschii]RUR72215.1 hypothetical protein PCC6912_64320 [Chlorogloeopsis fritschii PCC 6912]
MNEFQNEQLFTELNSAEASVIEGGASVINSNINFDFALDSRQFAVTAADPRVSLRIGSLTSRGDDGVFTAALKRRTKIGTTTVGKANVSSNSFVNFGSQKPGNYFIQFTDKKDGKRVVGPIQIVVA